VELAQRRTQNGLDYICQKRSNVEPNPISFFSCAILPIIILKDAIMSKYISGVAKESNLDRWASYSRRNSFDRSETKAQSKDDLAPCGRHDAEEDYKSGTEASNWHQPQKDHEGRGWAPINPAAKPNTYTDKGGSKRD
jgi:hypothetical protein